MVNDHTAFRIDGCHLEAGINPVLLCEGFLVRLMKLQGKN